MGTKICNKCSIKQNILNFGFDYRYTPPRRRHRCNECSRKANIISRKKNQKKYNEQARNRRNERKLRAIEYKGGVCAHCKQKVHTAAFDFHHINKDEKDTDPGLMMGMTDENLFKELDKCILLCANCHRIEHFKNGY